jgi:hypothetical protein
MTVQPIRLYKRALGMDSHDARRERQIYTMGVARAVRGDRTFQGAARQAMISRVLQPQR